jgi:hypothetical protein
MDHVIPWAHSQTMLTTLLAVLGSVLLIGGVLALRTDSRDGLDWRPANRFPRSHP